MNAIIFLLTYNFGRFIKIHSTRPRFGIFTYGAEHRMHLHKIIESINMRERSFHERQKRLQLESTNNIEVE